MDGQTAVGLEEQSSTANDAGDAEEDAGKPHRGGRGGRGGREGTIFNTKSAKTTPRVEFA
jgi:hypothetical protein